MATTEWDLENHGYRFDCPHCGKSIVHGATEGLRASVRFVASIFGTCPECRKVYELVKEPGLRIPQLMP
jgi:predicted RNA-binding Zn-ribbon protein involved in translation (DUF1610 family)